MQQCNRLTYLSPTGVAIPVSIANTFKKKFLGLAGKKEETYGLLLQPCNSIHTYFMRYPLDAIFLDERNKIIAVKRLIKPFSVVSSAKGTSKALVFPSSLHASAFLSKGEEITLYKNLELK